MHIMLLVVIAGNANVAINLQTILTFSLSVISAANGITKFMSVGPCRLIPYDKVNVGFLLVLLSNGACLAGKGFLLGTTWSWVTAGRSTTPEDQAAEDARKVGVWVSLSLLPSLMFVSTYVSKIY